MGSLNFRRSRDRSTCFVAERKSFSDHYCAFSLSKSCRIQEIVDQVLCRLDLYLNSLTGLNMERNSEASSINTVGAGEERIVMAPTMPRDNSEGKEFEEKNCIAENSLSETANESQDALSLRSTNFSSDHSEGRAESRGIRKTIESKTSPKHRTTVPHPFSFATEKRASTHVSQCAKANVPSPSKPASPPLPRKPIKHIEEEDDWSAVSSSSASQSSAISSRPNKPVTIGTAPSFKSAERLDKRKEFYTKLEEKHRALAAEKTQEEARTKEEQEAAIKQLRKNMVVRSNPIPSFYYEPPPPKPELKKLPLTQPTSPKFNIRRKSCSDAMHMCPEGGVRDTVKLRYSTGNPTKSKAVVQKGNGVRKIKDRAEDLIIKKGSVAHQE